jgi:hypothetical protein
MRGSTRWSTKPEVTGSNPVGRASFDRRKRHGQAKSGGSPCGARKRPDGPQPRVVSGKTIAQTIARIQATEPISGLYRHPGLSRRRSYNGATPGSSPPAVQPKQSLELAPANRALEARLRGATGVPLGWKGALLDWALAFSQHYRGAAHGCAPVVQGRPGDAQVRTYEAARCKTSKQADSGAERDRLGSCSHTPDAAQLLAVGKMR